MPASLGSLVADMVLKTAAFTRDLGRTTQVIQSNANKQRKALRDVQRASRNLSKSFSVLKTAAGAVAGALAVRQFVKFTTAALDSADAIAKQADRLKISTGALQEYRLVAELSGVATDKLDKGIAQFTRNLGDLRAGTGTLTTFLDRTNKALKEQLIAANSTEEGLQIFMRALGDTKNQFDRVALSAAGMSARIGISFVNIVKNGADATENLRNKIRELGLVMSDRVLRQAEVLKDDIGLLRHAFSVGFDTAIIESFAGSVDASVDKLKELRRIGTEFGTAVGGAMKAVVNASKFIVRNLREIGTALTVIVAIKAAAVIIGIAVAFTKMVVSVGLAVKALVLMDLTLAKTVLGSLIKLTIGVGAATVAWQVYGKSATEAADVLGDLAQDIQKSNEEVGKTKTSIRGVAKLTQEIKRQAAQYGELRRALAQSQAEFERVSKKIELQNAALRQGIDLTTAQGKAWAAASRASQQAKGALDSLIQKRKDDAEEMKRQAIAAEELARQPFINALEGIQSAFTDTFEKIFLGGVNSFKDLANAVKGIMVRMAAEIATLLVFKPIVASALGSLGLTGISSSLGLGGSTGSLGGGGFGLFSGVGSVFTNFGKGFSAGSGVLGSIGGGFSNVFSGGKLAGSSGLGGTAPSPLPAAGGRGGPSSGQIIGLTAAIQLFKGITQNSTNIAVKAIDALLLPSPQQLLKNPALAISPAIGFAGLLNLPIFGGKGLFGPGPSVGPNGGASLRVDEIIGRAIFAGGGGDNGLDTGPFKDAVRGAVDTANAVLDSLGGKFTEGAFAQFQTLGGTFQNRVLVGAERQSGVDIFKSFEDSTDALNDLLINLFKRIPISGIADEIQLAIKNSTAESFENFAKDLELAGEIAALTGSGLTAFEQSVNAINTQFNRLVDGATRLGIATEGLEAARARELGTARFAAQSPFLQAAEQIAGFVSGTKDQFASPANQLIAKQSSFSDLLAQVRGGETGLTGALLQSAQDVIGLGRVNFASSVDFANIESFVQSSLLSVAETLSSDDFFDAQIEAVKQQTNVLSGDLSEIAEGVERLRRTIESLRVDLAEAA